VGTLKPQSNEALYSNRVIGTLAVDEWAVIVRARRGGDWAGCGPSQSLLAVPNVTACPSTACVPSSHYSTRQYNCLWILKG